MTVLGVDASYTRTGLVWLDSATNKVVHHATLSVPVGPNRLLRAARAFHKAMVRPANLAVIEDAAYGSPSRTTLVKLVELSATFKLVMEGMGMEYLCVSPTLVKKWVTGKGTAEKHIVARELKRKYGIAFKDDVGHDLSDAAACAAWGLLR